MSNAANTRKCLICETDFIYKSVKALYCSKKCNATAYRRRHANRSDSDKRRMREKRNKWYQDNKERQRLYRKNNMKDYHKQYWKERRSKDLFFKLRNSLRNRLYQAIKNNQKSGSAVSDLGCSIEFLKSYLESKFTEGMTWENIGEWHIDHIKPLSSFNLENREELLKACHYTNLQPLWAKDNLSKGNKYV